MPNRTCWRADWERLTVCFAFPAKIRKVIYDGRKFPWDITDAIESLNDWLRYVIKNRRAFPPDGPILDVFYLGLRSVTNRWTRPIQNWTAVLNQFVTLSGDRVIV